MKTKILSLLAAASLCLAFGACSDDPNYPVDPVKEYGAVSLEDLGVVVNSDEVVISRADADDNVDTSSYIVKILDADGNEVYNKTVANSQEVITLPVATGYKIQVHSHEVENAAWSAPHYMGEQSFDVKKNDITKIGRITCKFSNVRVSIRYTDKLKALLHDDCKVTVKCSETGSSLDFVKTEERSGYFKGLEGSTTLAAEFSGTVKGHACNMTRALNDVKPGQHRIVTFDVKTSSGEIPDEFGGISVTGAGDGVKIADGLWLVADVTTVTINGGVIMEETGDGTAQRPGKEDPKEPDQEDPTPIGSPVTITGQPPINLDAENPLGLSKYCVEIHADKGIENLRVVITSTNNDFMASAGEMLPLDFDLAHPATPELAETIKNDLTLPVGDEVLGQNDVLFEVPNFLIDLLGAFPGKHTFTLTVVDPEGNTLTKKLVITV